MPAPVRKRPLRLYDPDRLRPIRWERIVHALSPWFPVPVLILTFGEVWGRLGAGSLALAGGSVIVAGGAWAWSSEVRRDARDARSGRLITVGPGRDPRASVPARFVPLVNAAIESASAARHAAARLTPELGRGVEPWLRDLDRAVWRMAQAACHGRTLLVAEAEAGRVGHPGHAVVAARVRELYDSLESQVQRVAEVARGIEWLVAGSALDAAGVSMALAGEAADERLVNADLHLSSVEDAVASLVAATAELDDLAHRSLPG